MAKGSKVIVAVAPSTEGPAITAEVPAVKVARASVMSTRTVTLVKMPATDAKIAAQAMVICKALEASPLTETALIAALAAAGLKTVQTPKRIYTFYRKTLEDGGYIKRS